MVLHRAVLVGTLRMGSKTSNRHQPCLAMLNVLSLSGGAK